MSDHKYDILHVKIPFHKGDITPDLIGNNITAYDTNGTRVIGVITDVDVKTLDVYATITDEKTIDQILEDRNPMSMTILDKEEI